MKEWSGGISRPAKLEAVGIGKQFYQARLRQYTLVLEDINLQVAAGEFVTIVGPSGCGKTTFLYILDGLLRPTSGQVLVDGQPVTAPGKSRAMVFQDAALLPWRTVLRNTMYSLECLKVNRPEAQVRAQMWLEVVGLQDFAKYYPHELSGGMQQRVNLARAMAVDPAILLMDEPFASLDAQTRETMQAELLSIWTRTRKTIVFVTHQIAEAIYLADRVVVFTARPAQVRETIEIDLPRPRDDSTRRAAWFRDCEDYVSTLLK